MDQIICLIGESGSGKSTVAALLQQKMNCNLIRSYTTRPPRHQGEQGHIFANELPVRGPAAAEVTAHTVYGGHHYWSMAAQYRGRGLSVYPIDPPGAETLRRASGIPVVIIYLKTDEYTRWMRMAQRRDRAERTRIDQELFRFVLCDYAIDANGESERTSDYAIAAYHHWAVFGKELTAPRLPDAKRMTEK